MLTAVFYKRLSFYIFKKYFKEIKFEPDLDIYICQCTGSKNVLENKDFYEILWLS